jgi:peptidoglycan hydrolase FlgJ
MKISTDSSIPTAGPGDIQKQARLVDAAQQFEATMLQELLKPMQHGNDSWGGEKTSDDSGSDTISSLGTEAVAKAISKGGGFGIARRVVAQVNREHHQNQSEKRITRH